MGSTLIVYYTYTGNSRQLAHLLAAQHRWPVGEVIEKRPRNGLGYVRCILDSVFRRRPAVRYEGPDPSNFETVVLVAPVWMQQLAGPMRSFVSEQRSHIGRVAVLMTMGARGGSNAVAEIGRLLDRDPVVSEVVTAREVEDGSCAQAVDAFGASVDRAKPSAPLRPAMWSPEAG